MEFKNEQRRSRRCWLLLRPFCPQALLCTFSCFLTPAKKFAALPYPKSLFCHLTASNNAGNHGRQTANQSSTIDKEFLSLDVSSSPVYLLSPCLSGPFYKSLTFLLLLSLPFDIGIHQSSQRDMEREIRELDRQEKQITMELKQRAKTVQNTNDPALAALAKQMVQVRKQREKLLAAKAQIGAVGMHATSMASQVAAASALGSVTDSMKTANSAMDVKATTKIMQEFTKENERLEVKQELMDDGKLTFWSKVYCLGVVSWKRLTDSFLFSYLNNSPDGRL